MLTQAVRHGCKRLLATARGASAPHHCHLGASHEVFRRVAGIGPVRCSTVWEALKSRMISKTESKEEEQFRQEVQRLSTREHYNFRDFKSYIENMDKQSWFSWVNKLPGVRDMPQVQQAEKFKKILKVLKEEELRDPKLIKGEVKQRIVAESGQSNTDISALMTLYENSRNLHRWVRCRVRDGKPLPQRTSELQVMMRADPKGIIMDATLNKQMAKAARKSGRGQR